MERNGIRSIFLPVHYLWNTLGIMRDNRIWDIVLQCFLQIKKIYQKKEDQIAAAKRHMEFFNTTPYISTAVFGISTAMEESNARNEDFVHHPLTM